MHFKSNQRRQTAKVVTVLNLYRLGQRKKTRENSGNTHRKEAAGWLNGSSKKEKEGKTTKSCFVVFINIYEWKRARNIKRLIKFPATARQPPKRGEPLYLPTPSARTYLPCLLPTNANGCRQKKWNKKVTALKSFRRWLLALLAGNGGWVDEWRLRWSQWVSGQKKLQKNS